MTKSDFERACAFLPPDFVWGSPMTPRIALHIAQAAEAAAIERCAKLCEAVAKELLAPGNEEAVFGAVSCRDAIRALKTDGGNHA